MYALFSHYIQFSTHKLRIRLNNTYTLAAGPTRMNDPPSGFPSPTCFANVAMLKSVTGVDAFTNWPTTSLKLGGWAHSRKTYL